MTGAGRTPPLPGPLHERPRVDSATSKAMLTDALTGIELGAYDDRILAGEASGWDAPTRATVASLLRRAWAAGVAVGRAELAEESAAVARLRAELASLARALPEVDVCGVDGYVCQACGVRYGGRIFDCTRVEIDWSRRVTNRPHDVTGGGS